jgi:proteasome lid subunit RPN8/RPN11
MLTIRRELVDSIIAHAWASHPGMACGLVAGPCGSDRPERLVRMENAAHSPTFWEFDALEQFRAWRDMDERGEEPVVIYYSQNYPGAYPSKVTSAYASESQAHYVVVSTYRPGNAEFRSFRILDGRVAEEEVRIESLLRLLQSAFHVPAASAGATPWSF